MKRTLPFVALVAFVACASHRAAPPVTIVVTTDDARMVSTAAQLRSLTAEAIQREDGAPRAATVSIVLNSRDVVVTNSWVAGALTHRTPLFGPDADLTAPPPNLPVRGGTPNLGGTVITGNYLITDAAGNVLASEPFNLGFVDMNHLDRKLLALRKTGDYIAARIAQLR